MLSLIDNSFHFTRWIKCGWWTHKTYFNSFEYHLGKNFRWGFVFLKLNEKKLLFVFACREDFCYRLWNMEWFVWQIKWHTNLNNLELKIKNQHLFCYIESSIFVAYNNTNKCKWKLTDREISANNKTWLCWNFFLSYFLYGIMKILILNCITVIYVVTYSARNE